MAQKDPDRRRELQREAQRRYRERNPEKVRESQRRWRERNPEKVREMRREQGQRRWLERDPEKVLEYRRRHRHGTSEKAFGPCDVCGEQRQLVQDHDHACQDHPVYRSCPKCRRGLLCQGCNQGEGCLGSNANYALALAAYLHHWGVRPEPRPSEPSEVNEPEPLTSPSIQLEQLELCF